MVDGASADDVALLDLVKAIGGFTNRLFVCATGLEENASREFSASQLQALAESACVICIQVFDGESYLVCDLARASEKD